MIQVENLRKSFNGVEVLKGISTTFEKGKTNLIIGQRASSPAPKNGNGIPRQCPLRLDDCTRKRDVPSKNVL